MSDHAVYPRIITAVEHENISSFLSDSFQEGFTFQEQPKNGEIQKIWSLGLSSDGSLNYYIGLDWLDDKNSVVLRVNPKIRNIDFFHMFKICLESPVASSFLAETYDVKIDSRYIPHDDGFDFTIILLTHYLHILKNLIKKPLKKGYVSFTENLSSKLKGKIQIGDHFKKNILNLRSDKMYCTYQEYSSDCLENRILKTAFEESIQYITHWNQGRSLGAFNYLQLDHISAAFTNIGKITHLRELQGVKGNPIFKGYAEALRLAKLILRIRGYQEEHSSQSRKLIPPFIIDMSKLFELYVYHHLHAVLGKSIAFQQEGKFGAVDYLDLESKLVIDAKYKTIYENEYKIEDIRQLSGYARDVGILSKLSIVDRDKTVPCLIIYPSNLASTDFSESYRQCRNEKIPQFHQMFKLGLKLPQILES